SVTNAKVGADAITTDKIKDGEVKTADVADKNITASKLDAGTGTAGRLAIADATGAVTYSNTIPSGSITGENVTAGSNKVTLGGTPAGAALKAFSVDVTEANLTLSNIGGKVTNNQITTGTANQMLVTNAAGTATVWVDKSAATSVSNASVGNTITTTVNGTTGTAVNIINTNATTLDAANKLITTVNGVASTPLDISTAVVATQKTTTLSNGLNTTVAGTTTGNVTDYKVNVATANGTTAGVVKQLSTSPVTINSNGELGLNANNGLTVANNNVQLGGTLNQATTVTTGTNLLTVATGGNNTMAVTGLQTGAVTDQLVVADANGILKQVKAAMPKFFYMPSVVIPTAADQFVAESGVTGESFGTMNLYDRYSKQFLTPLKSSPGAPALPIIAKTDLYYYVTWYDTTVFTNVQVSAAGVLTYTVVPGADVTVGSFMNIVFAVK
ncbi:hypothetical protein, partial [Pedobacter frigidisoli]|uniref:hypothetical protein n=1 Tax=Pedobacter frigidisoli TaxID=2530455 RepID=UPI0029306808